MKRQIFFETAKFIEMARFFESIRCQFDDDNFTGKAGVKADGIFCNRQTNSKTARNFQSGRVLSKWQSFFKAAEFFQSSKVFRLRNYPQVRKLTTSNSSLLRKPSWFLSNFLNANSILSSFSPLCKERRMRTDTVHCFHPRLLSMFMNLIGLSSSPDS